MSTLRQLRARMPALYQVRFGEARWVQWANALLEELGGQGILPETECEKGFVVENEKWITKPSSLRTIHKIFSPSDDNLCWSWEEVEGKIRLINGVEFTDTDDPDAITTFSAQAVDSITANVTGKEEDEFANALLYVTAGILANTGFILSGNDKSGATTTKIYYLHALASAWTAGMATAGAIYNAESYVMMKYAATYASLTSESDTVPVSSNDQLNVFDAWLRYKCELETTRSADAAAPFYRTYQIAMRNLETSNLKDTGGPIRGRKMFSMHR